MAVNCDSNSNGMKNCWQFWNLIVFLRGVLSRYLFILTNIGSFFFAFFSDSLFKEKNGYVMQIENGYMWNG